MQQLGSKGWCLRETWSQIKGLQLSKNAAIVGKLVGSVPNMGLSQRSASAAKLNATTWLKIVGSVSSMVPNQRGVPR